VAKVRFTVEPRMLGRFEKRLTGELRQSRIRRALKRAGDDIVHYLMVRSEPVFYMGDYRTGWYATARARDLVIGNRAKHFINVEKGRRAGAPMPPHAPLLRWVLSKGMQASAAFPVRRAISERGIEGRPLFFLEETQRHMQKLYQKRLVGFLDRALMKAAR
jgi:hypothetical protein